MAGIGIQSLTDKVSSHALALGYFEAVNTHEPTVNPTTSGLTVAVWVNDIVPVESSGLASTSVALVFNVRIMQSFLSEPRDMLDVGLVNATDALLGAYSEDFTLDGELYAVDLLGMHTQPLSAEAGYVEEGERIYRVMTITLPLIINDVWEQSA